jgi:hypothetical protein
MGIKSNNYMFWFWFTFGTIRNPIVGKSKYICVLR